MEYITTSGCHRGPRAAVSSSSAAEDQWRHVRAETCSRQRRLYILSAKTLVTENLLVPRPSQPVSLCSGQSLVQTCCKYCEVQNPSSRSVLQCHILFQAFSDLHTSYCLKAIFLSYKEFQSRPVRGHYQLVTVTCHFSLLTSHHQYSHFINFCANVYKQRSQLAAHQFFAHTFNICMSCCNETRAVTRLPKTRRHSVR